MNFGNIFGSCHQTGHGAKGVAFKIHIQTCYNNIAKDLYRDPYVFSEEQSEYLRDDKLTARFTLCIESTVKELIPIQQILQTYMSQETRDISLDGEVVDGADPDVFDGEPEPEPYLEPEPEPEMEMEMEPEPTGLENEFKTVPGVQAPEPDPEPEMEQPQPQAQAVDDDVFFGDAPEQRTKNPRYN